MTETPVRSIVQFPHPEVTGSPSGRRSAPSNLGTPACTVASSWSPLAPGATAPAAALATPA